MRSALALMVTTLVAGCAAPRALVNQLQSDAQRTITLDVAGETALADVYRPDSKRVVAVVVLAHGFSRSRATLAVLASELADAGFAVIVPDLPHFSDHLANARFLVGLAASIEQRAQPDLDFGEQQIIFAGFSAGATASLLAASSSGASLGWIGLDPVDARGVGSDAAARLREPAFVFRSPPSSCNAHYNFGPALARLPNVMTNRVEPGASHCDFEAPTDAVCTLVCGAASAERQRAIRAAVVAAARAIAAP